MSTIIDNNRVIYLTEDIKERTKITTLQLEENRKTKTDWYIPVDEAIKLGCADEELLEI